jgi:hypothetical protein
MKKNHLISTEIITGIRKTDLCLLLILILSFSLTRLAAQSKLPMESFNICPPLQKKLAEMEETKASIEALNFVNTYAPIEMLAAARSYEQILNLAKKGENAKVRQGLKSLKSEYNQLLKTALLVSGVNQYDSFITEVNQSTNQHLKVLQQAKKSNLSDVQVFEEYDRTMARVNLDNFLPDYSVNFDYPVVGYDPGPPPGPMMPLPAATTRDTNRLIIRWQDRSDDEDGFRLYRSARNDALEFQLLREFSASEGEGGILEYTDQNVYSGKRYIYKVEAFNDLGANDYIDYLFTLDSIFVPVLRIQLQVNIANKEDAGSDPARIYANLGNNTLTFMDYSHDDFERNTKFKYDLNLGDIDQSWDIQFFSFHKEGGSSLIIDSFVLWINNTPVFKKGYSGGYEITGQYHNMLISLEEIRNQNLWQNFISSSLIENVAPYLGESLEIGDADPLGYADVTADMKIEAAEMRSRLEGMVGHTNVASRTPEMTIGWGDTTYLIPKWRYTVFHLKKKDENSLQMEMKLKANPSGIMPVFTLYVTIDLNFEVDCEGDDMIIRIQPGQPTFNSDFADWKDILSAGGLKLVDLCIDRFLNECDCGMDGLSEQEFRIEGIENLDCSELALEINEEGDILLNDIKLRTKVGL